MKEEGISEKEVMRLLEVYKRKDLSYSTGKILSSMCTAPRDLSREVYELFSETNLGDPGLFEGTRNLEKEAVRMIGSLLGNNSAEGFILSGGTEANIAAIWTARNKMKKKRPEVILPESAHFSLEKAADLLGVKLIMVPLVKDFSMDVSMAIEKINENTIALVGIAGSTEYGAIDDIQGLSEVAVEHHLPLHVDAAFGGFVIPFLRELGYETRDFDFSIDGVASITVDPHKMGLAPIPCGGLLVRHGSIFEFIGTSAPYLTREKHFTISGTRSGASAAVVYALLKHLGRVGYRENVRRCMEVTMHLYEGLRDLGIEVLKPWMNILVFKDDGLRRKLSKKGWVLSRTRRGEARLIIMPHVTMEVAQAFLRDVGKALSREGG